METLPSEIITQILEYLPFDDRRELARVNKVFYHASSHPVFLKKELLNYEQYRVNLNNFNDFKNMLLKSRRKLLYLKFVHLTFLDLTIFTSLGNHIISLSVIDLVLPNDSFLDAITQCCSNLEKLELIDVMNLILTNNDRKPILKLCSLTLNNIKISDRGFNLILKLAPNLKDLSILDCHLVGTNSVMKRVYPHSSNYIDCSFTKYNSNDIFSGENILHHLNNFVRLNSLRLNDCSSIFYRIQPIQLEIKSLSLNVFETIESLFNPEYLIDYEKLKLVLRQYIFLEQLEIFGLPVEMLSIVSELYNLRHLTLSYTINDSNYLDSGKYLKSLVESFKNMKYIRTLSLNYRGFLSDLDIDSELPIYPFLECTLKSLTSLDCSLDSNLGVLKFGKNLTNLRIRNGDILKVEDLQLLFRNLTYLKHLWVEKCSVLNDEIFIKLPISNLKELITLHIIPSNISHRCLRHITNSRLKVLYLTEMSLEPCSTKAELNEFKHSIEILSHAVPKLTQLKIPAQRMSMEIIKRSDNSIYFETNFMELLKTYFKRLKILKLFY
ncbi:uncharacterized protein LOC107884727 [Acyrthosiphon pisum]|uniref:F-box domain-containing protein n=1 Tax=Acyrthosiphon pisum TaxID=7029 RepID=A0A8R2H6N1_ACYPI|nr:uncharacterized protein LOC107884727 [Acyrthosiphon pisum]|eukprot:XP_016662971.1 PREDICTED: uncharacterized protein LOC107884727 isoform X1 [Acyrthosiphon pisum]